MRFSRTIATSSLIVALLAASVSAPASAAPTLNGPKSAPFSAANVIHTPTIAPMFSWRCYLTFMHKCW